MVLAACSIPTLCVHHARARKGESMAAAAYAPCPPPPCSPSAPARGPGPRPTPLFGRVLDQQRWLGTCPPLLERLRVGDAAVVAETGEGCCQVGKRHVRTASRLVSGTAAAADAVRPFAWRDKQTQRDAAAYNAASGGKLLGLEAGEHGVDATGGGSGGPNGAGRARPRRRPLHRNQVVSRGHNLGRTRTGSRACSCGCPRPGSVSVRLSWGRGVAMHVAAQSAVCAQRVL